MIKVKITGTVITAQYGTLSSGDVLTTNEDFAKHLVEECAAAEYLTKVKEQSVSRASAERQQSVSLLEKAKKLFK